MTSTLAERVKERMQALGMKNAELARQSGVQPPTSFNWSSGKTKAIKGEPLLKAAAALQVTPKWLATGRGPKFPSDDDSDIRFAVMEHRAEEEPATYRIEEPEPALLAAEIVRRLPPAVASEALAYLRWLAARHTPPVI
jgi:transcriptional regulator with XRE-family HTH domain